jgi:hypothetical protein
MRLERVTILAKQCEKMKKIFFLLAVMLSPISYAQTVPADVIRNVFTGNYSGVLTAISRADLLKAIQKEGKTPVIGSKVFS